MDTYYTIEEKYLKAVDEVTYGQTPKALNMLNTIIADDALYARAHYQLGKIYFYDIKDYQTAGYHFKTCMELEPAFPDNYLHYLSLVVFLKMDKLVEKVAAKALTTPGVVTSEISGQLGLYAERAKEWQKALTAYTDAFMEATDKTERDDCLKSMKRVKEKLTQSKVVHYTLSG